MLQQSVIRTGRLQANSTMEDTVSGRVSDLDGYDQVVLKEKHSAACARHQTLTFLESCNACMKESWVCTQSFSATAQIPISVIRN